MVAEKFMTAQEAIAVIKFDPDQPDIIQHFISALEALHGLSEKKRPSHSGRRSPHRSDRWLNVRFGKGTLKDVTKDGPKTLHESLEPLRSRGVILSDDDDEAMAQIRLGFQKQKAQFREYPGEKWGWRVYPQAKLVV